MWPYIFDFLAAIIFHIYTFAQKQDKYIINIQEKHGEWVIIIKTLF
jgi:hypothetical protein